MDDDATSTQRSGRVGVIRAAHQVVVDDGISVVLIPDLDAELVRGPIPGREHKPIVSCTVDRAGSFILGLGSGNYQPVVGCALEVQVRHFELKLGVTRWHIGALLILRDKAKGCLVGYGQPEGIDTRRAVTVTVARRAIAACFADCAC